MRQLRFVFISLVTVLLVTNSVLRRKAIALLLSAINRVNKFTSGMKFWPIGFVSFFIAIVATVFVSGSFLNRLLLAASCTIFSLNSAFCTSDLGVEFDRAMATSAFISEKVQNVNGSLLNQRTIDTKKHKSYILAFDPDKKGQGHRLITEFSLQGGAWITPDKRLLTDEDGTNLGFTKEAIEEIYQADRSVDLKPGSSIIPSSDFYVPKNHFDNELFPEASCRLKNFIKKDTNCKEDTIGDGIVNILEPITKDSPEGTKTQAGKDARKKLGQALHTLQDFYAHTNWVELGFKSDEIDGRLGRSIIPSPPANMYTSEPVSQQEVATALAAQVSISKGASKIPNVYAKFASKVLAADLLLHTPEGLASAFSDKPGIINPKFKGTRNKNFLTSGYFEGVGWIDSCKIPKRGKTRHGLTKSGLIWCNGLNKDEEGRDGYGVAQSQAVKATIDYINQIIYEEPSIRNNLPAIKVLMGMKDPPCKSKDDQNREECKLKSGKSYGDPHIATFDGMRYSFQTVGEFILTKSGDSRFEIQTRQAPVNPSLSLNSAVAMRVGSNRVALYAKDFPDADTSTPLRVNGKPTTIQDNKLALPGGGEILKQGNAYVVNFSTGEKVVVSPIRAGGNPYFNVSPFVYNRSGNYSGLLGNVNGNPNDDQRVRGKENSLEPRSTYGNVKQVLGFTGLRLPGLVDRAEKVYFDQLYKEFGNSWRVKQEESLFDYPPGKTTKSYVNPGFPDKYLTLNMLSADQIQKAQNACTEANVTQDLMEGCIFDVGFSGFSEFARATAEVNSYIGMVNQLFPGLNIPTTGQVVDRVIEKVRPKICLPIIGCR